MIENENENQRYLFEAVYVHGENALNLRSQEANLSPNMREALLEGMGILYSLFIDVLDSNATLSVPFNDRHNAIGKAITKLKEW